MILDGCGFHLNVLWLCNMVDCHARKNPKITYTSSDIYKMSCEIFGDGINNILLNNWFSKGFFKQLNKSSSGIARKYSIEAIYEIMIIKILSAYGFKLADIKLLIAEIDFQNRRSLGWILSGYKHGNIKYQPASDIVYNTSGMIV